MRYGSLVFTVFNNEVVFSFARRFLKSTKTENNSLDFSAVATRVIDSSGLQWRLTKH